MTRHMVALGSSFAAGPGLAPVVDRLAGRSGENASHQIARALGARLTDASVSGATTDTILHTAQRVGPKRFPPQITAIQPGSDADLVTITAGGNDLRYVGSLSAAAWGSWLAARPLTRALGRRLQRTATQEPPTQHDVDAAADGLAAIVRAVRDRAPAARVLLVDYLTIIGTETTRSRLAPFSDDQMTAFRRIADQLRDAFTTAAARSGAELVDVAAFRDQHAVGSVDPWVQGFTAFRKGDAALFHPTPAGMRAVRDAVLAHLGA
ncbi:SGNH/GDSL hydrolase family protein [Curtobacterium sp. VKM Ac-2922]|uniref:SGNH/GDSL hydrolase family protein n=1 Tax=Curtobacterium sp. VKM Ac-2922 TaxID=2929475 RepID=UPI001FB38B98|nr:SGNH/GDSL hydrolase family protein [Curtobacterium sp. VKM Ac-2922]MCJ1715546.1 SGNH/GDSL hydrolase family protein [Curtobacterium sp. VKM Ac-2922]